MTSIKRLRKLKGWNQTTLAEASGLEQSTISKIERGWDGATIRSLSYIAEALEVPLYQLFVDDKELAELRLLEVFRTLPDERKQGWLDMARAVLDQHPPAEE
ncbi:helix-turn-helix domain-containing protein [Phaeobacter italicus]|jgi:transcriptional regulator with XRE-family HTH domain|uniref:Anaerobic benzoate catabolism transcriptional regulator n=1 Tax=Phaeobacter italicus TaxID=481446 RepID=A0A0H5D0Y1_9RHOB|nr:helix-turn-helix transcriptional regulator [Phaeobacter italicus]MBO9441258.1 helix-turn-helix transcriptional regulator [Phaeobacter italicus]MBY5977006.1 helix-turn-helix domain-containing protein [Phaeobacter italicus]CRL10806.1 anaerobic benzoate catabolism transcriptional regulator [Phaeobacter italicus]|mmetsp:Transcript_4746/g.6231  ORF Transcript_4746/g.6231 Transcript_4746/m.6231 type:complete len:102 (+) Transcript_4746:12-317(+)